MPTLTHSTLHAGLSIFSTPTDHEYTRPTTGLLFYGPQKTLPLGLGVALASLGRLYLTCYLPHFAALHIYLSPRLQKGFGVLTNG
jgi:hypothetical protein